jgi:hypothetical protein
MEKKINHSSNKYLLHTYHVQSPVLVVMGIQRFRQNVKRKLVNNTISGMDREWLVGSSFQSPVLAEMKRWKGTR